MHLAIVEIKGWDDFVNMTGAPVDVIKLTDVGMNTARMDLTSTLNFVAPSFNYNKHYKLICN